MPTVAISAPSTRTWRTTCARDEPSASRTPNSRVRALTENASTLATPTTAISSATAANPDSTKALSRSGASTVRAHVRERRGALDRLVRVQVRG